MIRSKVDDKAKTADKLVIPFDGALYDHYRFFLYVILMIIFMKLHH